MIIQSQINRQVGLNIFLALGWECLIAATINYFTDNTIGTFFMVLAVLTVLYALIWFKNSIFNWLSFTIWGRKGLATIIEDNLIDKGYPEPDEFVGAISEYMVETTADEELPCAVRVDAAGTLGMLEGLKIQDRGYQQIVMWCMAFEDALKSYKKHKITGGKSPEMSQKTIDTMLMQAERAMNRAMEDTMIPGLDVFLQDERDLLKSTETDMIRIRERHKHNLDKLKLFVQDWLDYSEAIENIVFARQMLDVSDNIDAHDDYHEKTKESRVMIEEIERRVENELGAEALCIKVRRRINEKEEGIIKTMEQEG